jgi:CxxC motif-containing protein (DUF1111 family)
MSPRGLAVLALVGAVQGACGDNDDGDERQGGDTTVDVRDATAYTRPAPNLSFDEGTRFQGGRSAFDFRWEPPKLGRLFNNVSCAGCHLENGRGLSMFGMASIPSQALVRVSVPDGEPGDPGGPIPLPGFGTQLQDHAVNGLPEVRVSVSWIESSVAFDDGEIVALREPKLDVRTPDGTFLPGSTRMSYRTGPGVIGLGLLEAIPEATLRALADPDDADGDGVSGHVNMVWDPEQQATVLGRFGWKANTSTVHLQVAAAFVNDIGLSSIVFPEEGGFRDLNDTQLEDCTFFMSTSAVPVAATTRREAFTGRALFRSMGCAGCHTPTLVTGEHAISAVANQTIHPYTDLLLHDMGDRLSDGRPDFLAEGTEWRTPALWGIGLVNVVNPMATFLHDGRARSLAEAILWHGGEADAAREAFRMASRADRTALIAFLQSL